MSSLEEGVGQLRSSWLSLSHSPALLLLIPSDILASILFSCQGDSSFWSFLVPLCSIHIFQDIGLSNLPTSAGVHYFL